MVTPGRVKQAQIISHEASLKHMVPLFPDISLQCPLSDVLGLDCPLLQLLVTITCFLDVSSNVKLK